MRSSRGRNIVISSKVAIAIIASSTDAAYAAGDVVVVVAVLHEQRHRLRLAFDVPGHDANRAVLADRARRREDDAVRDGPADRRQRDTAEGRERTGAQCRGGLLLVGADLAEHRHDLAHDERQRDEDRREDHRGRREEDLERQRPEPAVAAVEEHDREADDDRRERERQVDDGVEHALAGEAVAHDRERADDAEDRVQRHGDRRDLQREPERVLRVGRRHRVPRGPDAVLERAPEDEPDGNEQDRREVREHPDAEAKPGDHASSPSGGARRPGAGSRTRSGAGRARATPRPAASFDWMRPKM